MSAKSDAESGSSLRVGRSSAVGTNRDVNKWIILEGPGRLKISTLLEKMFSRPVHLLSLLNLFLKTALIQIYIFCIITNILLVIISLKHKSTKEDKGNL